ncbi:hypothetical protein L1887_14731 [Cichorium endivia]|nr:hypothetical protein L1887_14731 [Cichorium endivia]
MSVLVSWARKEVARLRTQKAKPLLLPPTSQSQVGEIEILADVRCTECRIKVAEEMSKMKGMESIEVDVLGKKVILIQRSFTDNI